MPDVIGVRPVDLVYTLQLGTAAVPASTMLLVDNMNELPFTAGTFVGIIDRGTHTEEKVLCKQSSTPGWLEVVRGWDGTVPMRHAAFRQSQVSPAELAFNMGVQMQVAFGALGAKRAASLLDPHRLERMEKLAFAPVFEWVAEGEARAVKEFELA